MTPFTLTGITNNIYGFGRHFLLVYSFFYTSTHISTRPYSFYPSKWQVAGSLHKAMSTNLWWFGAYFLFRLLRRHHSLYVCRRPIGHGKVCQLSIRVPAHKTSRAISHPELETEKEFCNGVELRTLDYENPGSNPGCGVKTLGKIFHSTLLQFTQMYEYLATHIHGYVYEQPLRINCSIWLDASQRNRNGVWVNRSVREV